MKSAVIVTTYNQPRWLEKTLLGYAVQDTSDFEVYVADDGSGPETRAVMDRMREHFGARLHHVWHEDDGFRKCEILNRAIVAADVDYLIFTDGDCIPRADFVSTHLGHAEPLRFLSGGVIWLPRPLSEAVDGDEIRSGRIADAAWLAARGWPAGRDRLRLLRSPIAAAALDLMTTTKPTFNGHNASVWREALFQVNGFDAEMGYGGLDRALGERLTNLGLRGKQVRHRAICFHLDHDRPYRDPAVVARNRAIRQSIRSTGAVRATRGIAELTQTVTDRTGI